MSLYVYAIVGDDRPDIDLPDGVAGQPVYRVASGPLAAFVSDYQPATIRAERRHVAASQGVLRALQAKLDLLPTAFGTLTSSVDAVTGLLDRYREALLAQLGRIRGAIEMGVRLDLDVPDPIAYLVARSPELRQARDRTFGGRKPPSYEERIRLGQMCDSALRRYREAQAAQLVTLLSPACTAVSPLPSQSDRQVANLAALVPRADADAFEAAVHAAAETFDDGLTFRLSGPWPPYNFARLELTTG